MDGWMDGIKKETCWPWWRNELFRCLCACYTQQLSSHNDTSGQTQRPCVPPSSSSVPRVCDCRTFLTVGSVCCWTCASLCVCVCDRGRAAVGNLLKFSSNQHEWGCKYMLCSATVWFRSLKLQWWMKSRILIMLCYTVKPNLVLVFTFFFVIFD